MSSIHTTLQAAARAAVFCTLTLLAVTVLSTFAGLRVGFGWGALVVTSGELEFWWVCDGWTSWGWPIGIGAGLHSPEFHARPAEIIQTGVLGLGGWKTREWLLREPLWWPCIALLLASAILWPWTNSDDSRRPRVLSLVRWFVASTAAIVVGSLGAVGLSALAATLRMTSLLADVILRVCIPLALSGWLAFIVYRWLAHGRPGDAAPHCRRCGYDLTGNVSGRCPECGTPMVREPAPGS